MNLHCYIGIDPGASGGIACLVFDHCSDSRVLAAKPMPKTDKDIVDFLQFIKTQGVCFAVLEKVHSMPGQGVASTFKFGTSYGKLRMALVACEIPFEEASPQKWQKRIGCLVKTKKGSPKLTKTEKKNVNKAKAQELFPELEITHATADALLLAEYCLRTREL